MKRARGFTLFMLAALLAVHTVSLAKAGAYKKTLPSGDGLSFTMPSSFLKITSLEFKGLVSDFLFINAMVFHGSTYERKEQPRIKPSEWIWFHQALDTATDLDPYFFDPYFFANAVMTWEGGLIRETNTLLEKGMRSRDWDWMLPFFIGFNNFYFLRNNAEAARYLMESSQRPEASLQIASLASRLAYKEHQTENAIVFLETILEKTEEEHIKKEFEQRLLALRERRLLEIAMETYKNKFGISPSVVDDLVKKGILREIPRDPYGGSFLIAADGRILSTSDKLLMPRQH